MPSSPPVRHRRRAVFFDRDDTLVVNGGYLGDPAGVILMAGAAAAVAAVRRAGYATVVVSNQSGVARGLFAEDDVRAVDRRLADLLSGDDADAVLDLQLYCPHHPDGAVATYRIACGCRKPRPGMLTDAADRLWLDLSACWLVGDAERDVEAGRAAGCRTIRLASAGTTSAADAVVGTLAEAAAIIVRSHADG